MINSRTCPRVRLRRRKQICQAGCALVPRDVPRTRNDRGYKIFDDQLTQLGIDQMLRPLDPELSSTSNRVYRLLTETGLRDKVPGDGEYVFLVRLMTANGFVHFDVARDGSRSFTFIHYRRTTLFDK